MATLVALLDPSTVLEVGTGFGYSAAWLAYGLSLCSKPNHVFTIDDFTEGDLGGRGKEIALDLWERVGVRQWVDLVSQSSPAAMQTVPASSIGFAFIDGDHYGRQPVLDYEAVRDCLVSNGCIVFHDVVERYDVPKAVEMAKADGFYCIPVGTSCNPVIALRDRNQACIVQTAISIVLRGIVLGREAVTES